MSSLGDRVRLVHMAEDTDLVHPGDRGVVDLIDDAGTVHVRWDNGVALGLIPRVDRWVTERAAEDGARKHEPVSRA